MNSCYQDLHEANSSQLTSTRCTGACKLLPACQKNLAWAKQALLLTVDLCVTHWMFMDSKALDCAKKMRLLSHCFCRTIDSLYIVGIWSINMHKLDSGVSKVQFWKGQKTHCNLCPFPAMWHCLCHSQVWRWESSSLCCQWCTKT